MDLTKLPAFFNEFVSTNVYDIFKDDGMCQRQWLKLVVLYTNN